MAQLIFLITLVVFATSLPLYSSTECKYKPLIFLMDCSARDVMKVPRFKVDERVISLTLIHNRIAYLNLTVIKIDLPQLKFINVKENPLNCSLFCTQTDKMIPLVIISDCNCHYPRSTTSSSSKPSTIVTQRITETSPTTITISPVITAKTSSSTTHATVLKNLSSTIKAANMNLTTSRSVTIPNKHPLSSNLSYTIILFPSIGLVVLILLITG